MNRLIKLYGHPRSGTHFLLDLMYRNFYPEEDLAVEATDVMSGHWSKRPAEHHTFLIDGIDVGSSFVIPYAKLLDNDSYSILSPTDVSDIIYIIRDGRDVTLSCFNWKGALPTHMEELSLSEFLRTPIDWIGSPGYEEKHPHMTIFEHWMLHVRNYIDSGTFTVRYEDLVVNCEDTMQKIANHFSLTFIDGFHPVTKAVGWNPTSEQDVSKWKSKISESDIRFFDSIVPENFPGRWE